jgi:hypothetical protein
VKIDIQQLPINSHESGVDINDNLATIIIPRNIETKKKIAILCHELGHVVATELRLPEQMEDSRWKVPLCSIADITPEIKRAEQKAWDLADLIFQSFKEEALATYGIRK